MKKLYFEDPSELACEIYDVGFDGENDVSLVADFEIVSIVLQELFRISDGELVIMDIEIGIPECIGYEGPYLLTLTCEGEIWIQRARTEKGRMIHIGDDFIYTQEKYVKEVQGEKLSNGEVITIAFGKESKDEPKFKILKDQDDKPCGFEYHSEDDGSCLNMRYCSCDPVDVNNIVKIYNRLVNSMMSV